MLTKHGINKDNTQLMENETDVTLLLQTVNLAFVFNFFFSHET